MLTPSAQVFSDLVIHIFRVNGLLLAAGDELSRPVGLTSARWQVLGVVEHGPSTVAQVARTMGLARQSVRQTAEALAADGLVAFSDNPADRRARLMEPTPEGREALAYVDRRQADWANRIAEHLPPDELDAALGTLHRIAGLLASGADTTKEPHDR